MSDYYIKIIPVNPDYYVSAKDAEKIVEYLKSCITAYSVEVNMHETPEFVDCGGNLEDIRCPFCGKSLFTDWWTGAMNNAYENNFTQLEIKTPCCHKDTSLNELQYHLPCGFACLEFDIMNPKEELKKECIKEVERLLDIPVRVIHARV